MRRFLPFIAAPVIALILLTVHVLCFGITFTGASLCLLGFVAWTLFEYWAHRLAHVIPCLQEEHFRHHDHPRDPSRSPALVTLLGYTLITFLGTGFVGSAVFAGFLVGYTAFLYVHYAVHHFTIAPGQHLYFHKLRHAAHHRWDNVQYGVITDFWDIIWGTAH